jgi:hypothetical protein
VAGHPACGGALSVDRRRPLRPHRPGVGPG